MKSAEWINTNSRYWKLNLLAMAKERVRDVWEPRYFCVNFHPVFEIGIWAPQDVECMIIYFSRHLKSHTKKQKTGLK